jgi:hypothetical protein
MNITQAKAAMKKLFGAKAMWRYDESAPTADQREELEMALPRLRSVKDAAKATLERRRLELLQDPLYLQLKAECLTATDAYDKAESKIRHYRVTVGRDMGIAFFVEAQGDNWQDAIDKARAKVGKQ